jgi:hypothetical protein
MPNPETSLSFEQQGILQKQGLLPTEGNFDAPVSMIEVRQKNHSSSLLELAREYNFQETSAVTEKRDNILALVREEKLQSSDAPERLRKFAALLGEYQQLITDSLTQKQKTDSLVSFAMTAHLFNEMGWYDQAQGYVAELTMFVNQEPELEEQDLDPFYALLADAILIQDENQRIYDAWKKGFDVGPLEFAIYVLKVGWDVVDERREELFGANIPDEQVPADQIILLGLEAIKDDVRA